MSTEVQVIGGNGIGAFTGLQKSLRSRLVAASVAWENLDNELVDAVEEMVAYKRQKINQAKAMLEQEKKLLDEQI